MALSLTQNIYTQELMDWFLRQTRLNKILQLVQSKTKIHEAKILAFKDSDEAAHIWTRLSKPLHVSISLNHVGGFYEKENRALTELHTSSVELEKVWGRQPLMQVSTNNIKYSPQRKGSWTAGQDFQKHTWKDFQAVRNN